MDNKNFDIGDKVYIIHDNRIHKGEIISVERNRCDFECFFVKVFYLPQILRSPDMYSSREEAEDALLKGQVRDIHDSVAKLTLTHTMLGITLILATVALLVSIGTILTLFFR